MSGTKRPQREDRPRIALELAHYSESVRRELLLLADEFGWQFYDLFFSQLYVPSNPCPSGIVFSSVFWDQESKEDCRLPIDLPAVRLGNSGQLMSDPYPKVLYNMHAAGRLAVDYFAKAGYKTLAAFSDRFGSESSDLFGGVESRANERGMAFYTHRFPGNIANTDGDELRRWHDEAISFISTLPRPLALLGANDLIASRICYDCQSHGLSIPEDVAILGINNNVGVCEMAPVPISSVDLNFGLAMREAAQILRDMIAGCPPPEEPVLVPPKGVVRRRSSDMLGVVHSGVAQAIRYMWDHLDLPLTVEDICREVEIPKRTLSRLFQQNLGRSINVELRRKRLEVCCSLLKTTDMKIAQISQLSGFPSPSYLHRSFVKAYGKTPRDFRAGK